MQHAKGNTNALQVVPGVGTCDIERWTGESRAGRGLATLGCVRSRETDSAQQLSTDDTCREECSKCETVPSSSCCTMQFFAAPHMDFPPSNCGYSSENWTTIFIDVKDFQRRTHSWHAFWPIYNTGELSAKKWSKIFAYKKKSHTFLI